MRLDRPGLQMIIPLLLFNEDTKAGHVHHLQATHEPSRRPTLGFKPAPFAKAPVQPDRVLPEMQSM